MRNYIRDLSGGLVTDRLPVQLGPGESPEMSNVVLRNGAVRKRGGLPPFIRDRMPMNSIKNEGFATTAQLGDSSGAGEGNYRIVAGCLVAGHRPIYEAQTALSFDFFFEVGTLIGQHGGNGKQSGGTFDGSPYTIKVRPILSKGPVHRSTDTASTIYNVITWNTTVNTAWGNHSNSGMPFCLYIFNNGTGTAPVWQFRLSAHVLIAGTWQLQTVTSGVVPETGGLYHIVGAVSGSRVALRIARIFGNETPTYTANETTHTGTLAWNKCPIQVFDCPQQFIDATNVGSGTQRPGLNLNSVSTQGGYWFAAMRGEGRIEDLAIWSSDKFSSVATTLDRTLKLDVSSATSLINYWSMTDPGTDYVRESTGRGNALYFVPRGPVFAGSSGGKDGSSWFFNGQTSYALLDVNTSSYRYEGTDVGGMTDAVRSNLPHGMHVEFWVDAIEPQFEQVVAEIHGVMRLAIDADGKIKAYARSGGGAANSSQSIGEFYQTPVLSTITVVPGERYAVTVLRQTTGTLLSIYINGLLDNTGGLTASNSDAHAPSGITIGMGGYEAMIRAGAPDTVADYAGVNELNTDARSGFVGRVESFKLMAATTNTLTPLYKAESDDDWRYPETRTWRHPKLGVRSIMDPTDLGDNVRSSSLGGYAMIEGHFEASGRKIGYVIHGFSYGPTALAFGRDTRNDTGNPTGRFGNDKEDAIGVIMYHAMGYWRFNRDDRDDTYPGNYIRGLEFRYNAGTPTTANQTQNTTKHVHIQFSAVPEEIGMFVGPQRRCVESDVIDEQDASVFTNFERLTHRQRPYGFRSPRELGPRWARGIAIPLPGTVPVTLAKEWQVETDRRRFVFTASGRQLYWARLPWEADSPFLEAGRSCLSCSGDGPSHVLVSATAGGFNYSGTGTKTTVVFEGWVRPDRLDGRRLIAAKMTPSTSQSQASWFISTKDGCIDVQGTLGSGARTWGFTEASGGVSMMRRMASLRVGVWNHLHVTMNTAGVTVRVNGNLVPMFDMSTMVATEDRRDAHTSAAGDTPSGELHLFGLPPGRQRLTLTVLASASTVTIDMLPWAGAMSELRIRTAEDTTNWPSGLSGYPPRARFTSDGSTVLLLHLNEARGWFLSNSVGTDHAEVRIADLITIAEGLEESSVGRYDSVVYRDSLIVTNGEDHPKRITYRGRFAPSPFYVDDLGVRAPTLAIERNATTTTAGPGPVTNGTYNVWMSFLTRDGLESEPARIASVVVSGGSFATLIITLQWLPRSDDPQVVGRRLYASAVGGGDPIFNRDIGNDGYQHDVYIIGGAGEALVVGEKLEAPRGKLVAVAGSCLVIANLTEVPAGQNAFAFSTPDEPSQFTTASTATIDSQDGRPILNIDSNLSQLFFSKRDSVYSLAIGAIVTATEVQAELRPVNGSDGIGGGSIQALNMLWGAGDRGIFNFNNTAVAATDRIRPTWVGEVQRDDDAIFAMSGVYFRTQSEYWLGVRLTGQREITGGFVMSLPEGRISRITLPECRVLGSAEDPVNQLPMVLVGTTSGLLLRVSDDVYVEGSDDGALPAGAQTLDGTSGLSGTSTSLVMSGARFVTAQGGLRGIRVKITHDGITEERTISSNDGTTLRWLEPLTGWTAHTSFVIGGYRGSWSSPWVDASFPNREQTLRYVSLETVARAGNLTVRMAAIRTGHSPGFAFPTAAADYDEKLVAMSDGWPQTMPVPVNQAQGHYHRVEFSTDGIRTPFELIGYGLEITEHTARSHAGSA